MLALLALALTWLCVALGLAAGSVETASNTPMFLVLLPFISSAFVPTDSMPAGLAWFAEHQPFTPVIDTLRDLLAGRDPGADLWWAIGWCVLITARLLRLGASTLRDGFGQAEAVLTIGQLAAYAGVTTRAVRHYHQIGLLPEPERNASGYRTYDAPAVVELIRIRTLAEAGVPLARVQELLDADEEEFAAAVAEIDRRLRGGDQGAAGAPPPDRAAGRRRQPRAAAGGDRPTSTGCGPLGAPEVMVEMERDAWILIAARWPEKIAEFMVDKKAQLDDPRTLQLYRPIGELLEGGDRRGPAQRDGRPGGRDGRAVGGSAASSTGRTRQLHDDAFVDLLDSFASEAHPMVERLQELMVERGWTGWTRIERTPP